MANKASDGRSAPEPESLEAGRELDARVHRALGNDLPCTHDTVRTIAGTLMYCDGCGEEFGETTLAMARAWPHYSTDIAAAWEVVEKMRDHPDPRFRTLRLVAYSYNRTYATFDIENEDDWTEANGDHASPLAICRAALVALADPEVTLG